MNLKDLEKKLMINPKYAELRNNPSLEYQVARMLVRARIDRGITQMQLAKMIGTHQASIARSEKGVALPSLSFLKKIADAYRCKLLPPAFDVVETNQVTAGSSATSTDTSTKQVSSLMAQLVSRETNTTYGNV